MKRTLGVVEVPKAIRIVLCLVLLVTTAGTVLAQEDAICNGLKALHATHGDQFRSYLSDVGQQCLEPAVPKTASERIWHVEGQGPSIQSLSLDLTTGTYELTEPESPGAAKGGLAMLDNIVTEPEDCVVWEMVTFPAILHIDRKCQVYATLDVHVGGPPDRNQRWELSITRLSEEVEVPKADGWIARGRNFGRIPVDLVFEPGIYRTSAEVGTSVIYMWIVSKSKDHCLQDYNFELPNQFRVTQTCHIKARIDVGFWGGSLPPWSFEITKLG